MLAAQGFRRALIERSRYPSLPGDIPAVDSSGWPIYCQPPLPLERMVKESTVTPLDVPMHPRAAAVWQQHGFLP